MKTLRKSLGDWGENEACEYLEGLGHVILDRNWRGGHLELDIVSYDGKGLHFVEVKSRTAPFSAAPEESVDSVKRRRMCAAALKYVRDDKNGRFPRDAEMFFDVVTVIFDGDGRTVNYYPQAFLPIYV